MPTPGFQGASGIPVLCVQSAFISAGLAAGGEQTVTVTLPFNLRTPSAFIPGTNQMFMLASVTAQAAEANVQYVAEVIQTNPGVQTIAVKVRNVGTAAGGGGSGWIVNLMILGPGDAIGI